MEPGQYFPVTINHVKYGDDGISFRELVVEESLNQEGRNNVLFPKGWSGINNWPLLKAENFRDLFRAKQPEVDIDVDWEFILVGIRTKDGTEYFINKDDDDDYHHLFALEKGPNKPKPKQDTSNVPLESVTYQKYNAFDTVFPDPSPFTNKSKRKAKSPSSEREFEPKGNWNNNIGTYQPITLGITIKKGTSEYKKEVILNDTASCATIEFLSLLGESYTGRDARIFLAMLSEFEDMCK